MDVLGQAQFEQAELIGSVATDRHDQFSDIDILIRDPRRSPRTNVEVAQSLLVREFGSLLTDWAGSLLPGKCLISLFLPGFPLYWYIDIGCRADPDYPDITRDQIFEDRDTHLAKLLIMNAKHFLRGNAARLRIDDLYRKVIPDGIEATTTGKFIAVFDAIDYSNLEPELLEKSQAIIAGLGQQRTTEGSRYAL